MTVAPFDLPVIEVETIDPLQVVQDIAALRQTIADQQARLAERMETLNTCYAEGLVPRQFEAAGYTFQLVGGKTSYDWSSVPAVKEAEASLKAFKAECQQAGTVACTVGAPSWRLTPVKGAGA
jgi:hypothetical protein